MKNTKKAKYGFEVYHGKKPLMNRQGVRFPMQKIPYERYGEIDARLKAGETVQQIADIFGVSAISVRRAVKNYRIMLAGKVK